MILTINIGTTSLKFALYERDGLELRERNRIEHTESYDSRILMYEIDNLLTGVGKSANDVKAFGIRVVHGGKQLTSPIRVTDEVWHELEKTKVLAPLHNPPVLDAISVLRKAHQDIPVIAVFDTMFHADMPRKARMYAIPRKLSEKYGIERYGFHGLAHDSMLRLYCKAKGIKQEDATIITLQLGSGCSICAIQNGISVDTSMGFTPIEGLISRTRTGDIDPMVVDYLVKNAGLTADEVFTIMNKDSGLKGLSGTDGSLKEILANSSSGDKLAQETLEIFSYRIQKYIGAFDVAVGGADAIVFGGGISENSPSGIAKIFENPVFGVTVNGNPSSLTKPISQISTEDSSKEVYIAFVDEEERIASHVASFLF